jgi:hypothetical protein
VAFDTDLIKVKKLIKQVGAELLAEPEFAPHIIETVKMQGVEEIGDYGIRLRVKLITRPGEQFPIRRKAYQRIKELFDQNGVRFAVPTVQVAEGEEHAQAAAVANLRPVPSTNVKRHASVGAATPHDFFLTLLNHPYCETGSNLEPVSLSLKENRQTPKYC